MESFALTARSLQHHSLKLSTYACGYAQGAGGTQGDQETIEHEGKHPISGVDTRRIALFIRQDLGPSRLLQHLGSTSTAAAAAAAAPGVTTTSPDTVMGTLQGMYAPTQHTRSNASHGSQLLTHYKSNQISCRVVCVCVASSWILCHMMDNTAGLSASIDRVFKGPSDRISASFEIPSAGRLALPRTEPRPFLIPPPPMAITHGCGKRSASFCDAIFILKSCFYQDRLGTNIGKALKTKTRFK
jgi:hypothetical protein